jgi:hypothetical protein
VAGATVAGGGCAAPVAAAEDEVLDVLLAVALAGAGASDPPALSLGGEAGGLLSTGSGTAGPVTAEDASEDAVGCCGGGNAAARCSGSLPV